MHIRRVCVIVIVGAALGLAACGGKVEPGCSPMKEIATSSVSKTGDTWDVAITSNIDAPVDKVLEAASHFEKAHDLAPESFLKSELMSEEGNKKVLDIVARLEILPPGFKVQNIKTEFTYFPDEKRFSTKSIEFKLADITSDYRFEPAADGKGTVLKFTQKSKDKAPLIIDSLQQGALCETFAIQVRVVRRALGLEPTPAS